MKRRFIVIVLDGFGMGATKDAAIKRPGDEKACTIGSIIKDYPDLKLPNLEKLGLMNAYGKESDQMSFNPKANFGKAELMHFGADTFMGHQEIMGTLPKDPEMTPFQKKVDIVAKHLKDDGHKVEIVEKEGLRYVVCDDYVTIADNLEADLGMCYNVTAPLDFMPFEKELEIARKVREVVTVGRVVVFGGTGNTMDDLYAAEEIKNGQYIGIASAKSKSYDQGYQCLHLGYGVDPKVQAPTILTSEGIPCTLIGKVADIVHNEHGESISCVPTAECMDLTLEAMRKMDEGFICTNIQETDLAGHSQSTERYKHILEIADSKLPAILDEMKDDDLLVIMADHGNDPNIGHSKHTRENVPLLIKYRDVESVNIGLRSTLSDVGATVCDYFNVKAPQNGTSFYSDLKK